MNDFFLCHSSDDKDTYVRPLAKELIENGMSVWLDEAEIDWGDNLYEKIDGGLRESSFVIAFLSESFINKKWPSKELYSALRIEDDDQTRKVLPLMLSSPEIVINRYPLLGQKVYIEYSEGVSAIIDRCKKLKNKRLRIVSNRDFEVEDKEEMLRSGYSKEENIEYRFSEKVYNNKLRVKTELNPSTKVLVEIANRKLEDMAVEFGARSAVIDALAEKMPDKASEIEGNEKVMDALTNFAKIFAKPSLKKHRKRQSTVVLEGGFIEVSGLDDILDGWKADIKVVVI